MLSNEYKKLLTDCYAVCLKTYSRFYALLEEDLKNGVGIEDPFLKFIHTQLSCCVDILASSFNFSSDMEDRLSALSDRLSDV